MIAQIKSWWQRLWCKPTPKQELVQSVKDTELTDRLDAIRRQVKRIDI